MVTRFLLLLLSANLCFAGAGIPTIIRPCEVDDYKCIGDNLAANSNCNPDVKGFIPSKYTVPTFHFDTPYFNASYIDVNLIIRNHDKCFVSDFFFNTATGRAVLCIECPFFDVESDRTYIQHRSCSEDSYYYYHIRATYPLFRFTINFSNMNAMDLCSSSIFTDVVHLPIMHIDPQNKRTAKTLSRDLSLLNIYERENCHARGPPISFMFVDSLICDYGCPIPN